MSGILRSVIQTGVDAYSSIRQAAAVTDRSPIGARIAGAASAVHAVQGATALYQGIQQGRAADAALQTAQTDLAQAQIRVGEVFFGLAGTTAAIDQMQTNIPQLKKQIKEVNAEIKRIQAEGLGAAGHIFPDFSQALTSLISERRTTPAETSLLKTRNEIMVRLRKTAAQRDALVNRLRSQEDFLAGAKKQQTADTTAANTALGAQRTQEAKLAAAQRQQIEALATRNQGKGLLVASAVEGAVAYTGIGTATLGATAVAAKNAAVAAAYSAVETCAPVVVPAVESAMGTAAAAGSTVLASAYTGGAIVGGAYALREAYRSTGWRRVHAAVSGTLLISCGVANAVLATSTAGAALTTGAVGVAGAAVAYQYGGTTARLALRGTTAIVRGTASVGASLVTGTAKGAARVADYAFRTIGCGLGSAISRRVGLTS